MNEQERAFWLANLRVAHCCRDWPVSPLARMGRCGDCGQVPQITDKAIEQYQAERTTK